MNKNLIATALIPFILTLTACGGSDTPDTTNPYETISGSWQKLSSGQLTDYYMYYDESGNKTSFEYNTGSNCFVKHLVTTSLTVTSVNHIEGNHFVGVRDSGTVTSISYTVSADGNYLYVDDAYSTEYLKSDFTVDYYLGQLCE